MGKWIGGSKAGKQARRLVSWSRRGSVVEKQE
jgi:hypothetical protein